MTLCKYYRNYPANKLWVIINDITANRPKLNENSVTWAASTCTPIGKVSHTDEFRAL